uniref:Protein M2-2 n=2 Tax=Orthopneumovirus bovis TaxID=3050248 RepID=M22_BRSVA|nr:RecName: Full=Protein M2-2 [Bovine respiratory syncytial virus ATCC51908]AAL49412.1 M2-2 protein [Bovine respiratory syncytial virus ATCC51908]
MNNSNIIIFPEKYPCSISSLLIKDENDVFVLSHQNVLDCLQFQYPYNMYSQNHMLDDIYWTSQELIEDVLKILHLSGISINKYVIYVLVL